MSKRKYTLLAALVLVLAIADGRRPPERQVAVRLAQGGIHLYQRTLSPQLPALGVSCRFTPTCSRYADTVLEEHGIWAGSRLALARLARCGPWTPHGTEDLPPTRQGR